MNGEAPTANPPVPEPPSGRMSRPAGGPRWALSLLDFDAHAVDQGGDHPFGVFIALCGHRLLMTGLYDKPPGGLCPGCSQAVVQRRVEGGRVRWARSPGDMRGHAVAPQEATSTGWAQALCGAALPREELDLAEQPSSPLCSRCVTGAVAEPPPSSAR